MRFNVGVLFAVTFPAATFAAHVDISGGISIITPPDPGADSTPLYKVSASYFFTPRTSANAEVGYAHYRIGDIRYNYVPTKLRLIGHPRAARLLDPYFGGGLVYSMKKRGAADWIDHFGYSCILGLNWLLLHDATVGGYGEYVVPDWRSTHGYWEYGFNFGGISF